MGSKEANRRIKQELEDYYKKETKKEEIKQIRFKDLHLSLKVPIVVSYIVIILWILGIIAGLTT